MTPEPVLDSADADTVSPGEFTLGAGTVTVLRDDPVDVDLRMLPPVRREGLFFHAIQPIASGPAPSDGVAGTDTNFLGALPAIDT